MSKMIKRFASLLLVGVLFAGLTLTTGCGQAKEETVAVNADVNTTIKGCTLGEGNTEFTFQVVDADGNEEDFTIKTDETTVGAALLKVNLIAGDVSEYGLYVKTVNGITADYDVDKTYWAFYIDGDYAMTGVDTTDVTAGSTYAFKIEK